MSREENGKKYSAPFSFSFCKIKALWAEFLMEVMVYIVFTPERAL